MGARLPQEIAPGPALGELRGGKKGDRDNEGESRLRGPAPHQTPHSLPQQLLLGHRELGLHSRSVLSHGSAG